MGLVLAKMRGPQYFPLKTFCWALWAHVGLVGLFIWTQQNFHTLTAATDMTRTHFPPCVDLIAFGVLFDYIIVKSYFLLLLFTSLDSEPLPPVDIFIYLNEPVDFVNC